MFDDRVEITSAGSLPEGLSKEDFFEGVSIPRNKELMRVYKDLELVEQLGSGVPRILRSYGKECFRFMDSFTRMVFPSSKTVLVEESDFNKGLVDGLVESQLKSVRLIADNPKTGKREMSELTGISSTAIDNNIKSLKEKGLVERRGSNRTGYWEILIEK